ncbi:hypothetical protein N0V83_004486 [Neocucurbitaria cava]|uniref:Uncharacterized protein n=1 Tax=Neocucurbitaria cava TaxID=798079 RepID=A0A9W8Y9U6_9PLEO|nr:hypothetical protein N0V83_004486 [Neocucurbitaria cava]
MRTAVLQATALYALTMVLSHHLSGNMFEQVMENEGFQNMTNAWNKTMTLAATTNNTLEKQMTLDAGDTRNISLSFNNNGTTTNSTLSTTDTPEESFYGRWLPREIVVFALISVLQYWWLIWLERILPARPRRKTVPYQQHEKVAEESEDREEEVVKKWIAQGRRGETLVSHDRTCLSRTAQVPISDDGLARSEKLKHLFFNFVGNFLSITPFATLIAFIVVPAHKQIVFVTGVELVAGVFVKTVVRIFATWAVKQEFVQLIMKNMTDTARAAESEEKLARLREL